MESSKSSDSFAGFCDSSVLRGSQPAGNLLDLTFHVVDRYSDVKEPPLAVQHWLCIHTFNEKKSQGSLRLNLNIASFLWTEHLVGS